MNKEAYTNRVKRYLKRNSVEVDDSKVATVVESNFGKNPPSVAVNELLPKSTARSEKKSKAMTEFEKVLKVCCKAFELNQLAAKTGDGDNWRDLRSIACLIGLKKMKISPSSAMSEMLGLPNPAAVYHASNRAERLLSESVPFKMMYDKIAKTLKVA